MGKSSRFNRDNTGVDRYKHETPRERTARHQRGARGAGVPLPFDYNAWDRMHREAEDATLMRPKRREVQP